MSSHTAAWEKFDEWLKQSLEMGASDVHFVPGYNPQVRVNGELASLAEHKLDGEQTNWICNGLFGNSHHYGGAPEDLHTTRLYGNRIASIQAATAGGEKTLCVRFMGGDIPDMEKCNVPETYQDLLREPGGIVIVGGPHGSGKTTTLHMGVNWINLNRNVNICTIENPRYFVMEPAKALVQQHEVGVDGSSTAELIRLSLRLAPNVLMVSDIDSFDVLVEVIAAAETGHLVLIQMHASEPKNAIERLLSAAPPDMREGVRSQLSGCIAGVVQQRLVKRKGDKGRVAVCEVLGKAARKLALGADYESGMYLTRASDEIQKMLDADEIEEDVADRMRREFGC
ncbi:ATPase, T2SS/T4P/T4SS family [Planctomycetota bacterium]|nr:ATPase, T2SS/T4P/T4SS family [Planctomycetota bacterium]